MVTSGGAGGLQQILMKEGDLLLVMLAAADKCRRAGQYSCALEFNGGSPFVNAHW